MRGYTVYGYASEIEELLDDACNELSPKAYQKLLDDLAEMIDDRNDDRHLAQEEMRDYCERWEPTYNPEDGSM